MGIEIVWAIFKIVIFVLIMIPFIKIFKMLSNRQSSMVTAPVFTASVTVFSKAMNNRRYGSSYFIAFSFPDGTRKNIPVSVEQYNTIGEGETGILTYRQDAKYIWFVSFQPTT